MNEPELTLTRDSADPVPAEVVAKTKAAVQGDGFQAQIYKAISVQRPVVLEYLRSLRRDKPDASPAELLKELERRYVATSRP